MNLSVSASYLLFSTILLALPMQKTYASDWEVSLQGLGHDFNAFDAALSKLIGSGEFVEVTEAHESEDSEGVVHSSQVHYVGVMFRKSVATKSHRGAGSRSSRTQSSDRVRKGSSSKSSRGSVSMQSEASYYFVRVAKQSPGTPVASVDIFDARRLSIGNETRRRFADYVVRPLQKEGKERQRTLQVGISSAFKLAFTKDECDRVAKLFVWTSDK